MSSTDDTYWVILVPFNVEIDIEGSFTVYMDEDDIRGEADDEDLEEFLESM